MTTRTTELFATDWTSGEVLTTADVTFSSISTSFKLLKVMFDSSGELRLQFNDITSATYDFTQIDGATSSSQTFARLSSSSSIGESLMGFEDTGNQFFYTCISTSNFFRGSQSSTITGVTKIKLFPSSGTFSAGSKFILLGMK